MSIQEFPDDGNPGVPKDVGRKQCVDFIQSLVHE